MSADAGRLSEPQQQTWFITQCWSAYRRADGTLEPGTRISGTGISNSSDINNPAVIKMRRTILEDFQRIRPGEPFFVFEGEFVLDVGDAGRRVAEGGGP